MFLVYLYKTATTQELSESHKSVVTDERLKNHDGGTIFIRKSVLNFLLSKQIKIEIFAEELIHLRNGNADTPAANFIKQADKHVFNIQQNRYSFFRDGFL